VPTEQAIPGLEKHSALKQMTCVALICIPARGHVQRALLVTRGLVAAGAKVHAFCGSEFAADFMREGADFHDLYSGRPLDAADNSSTPIPSRFVTFAAVHGESLAEEVAKCRPDLLIHGTFAVAALVVGELLGIPRIALCTGHNLSPRIALAQLEGDPRVNTSPACHAAVAVLQEKYGIANASPFSYFDSLSSTLNIIPEPPEFLRDDETTDFRPAAFFGCIDPLRCKAQDADAADVRAPVKNVYVSFGTISHRYFSADIEQALAAIVAAAVEMPDCEFVITLGAALLRVPEKVPSNVRLETFVDQWSILAQADVYLTHNGLNSTHESIFLRKPMISYPLFADQPLLAKRCEELGLAVPLTQGLRAKVSPQMVRDAIQTVTHQRHAMRSRLETARGWEDRVISSRPEVIDRILATA
jgi:MGT family glycosyltransferase